MTAASESPAHLSIGEVLNILREEFPDVTISKIRFLESQGLVDPERTPSGYRKFYDSDVARLRWILHQQREHFLPLKVIKERLDEIDAGAVPADAVHDLTPAEPEPEPPEDELVSPGRSARASSAPPLPLERAAQPESEPEVEPPPTRRGGEASLTRAELARTAGLEDWQLAELESYGLLVPAVRSGDRVLFDDEGVAVARAAAGFYRHGIEARHLKMYKHFADREAALFEQVLVPYLRQRNPQARSKAQEELASLARLGRALRAALLVHAVRESLGE